MYLGSTAVLVVQGETQSPSTPGSKRGRGRKIGEGRGRGRGRGTGRGRGRGRGRGAGSSQKNRKPAVESGAQSMMGSASVMGEGVASEGVVCDIVRDGGVTSKLADHAKITTDPTTTGRDQEKELSEPTMVSHNAAPMSHEPTLLHEPTLMSHEPTVPSQRPAPMLHEPTLMSHEPTVPSQRPAPISHEPTLMSHEPTVASQRPAPISHEPISHDPSTESNNLSENDTEGLSSVQRLQMVLQNQPPPLIRDIDATDYSEDATKKRTLAAIVNKISQEKGDTNRVAAAEGVLSQQPPSLLEGGRKRGRKRKKSPLPAPVPKRPRGRPKGSIRKKELTGTYLVCFVTPSLFPPLLPPLPPLSLLLLLPSLFLCTLLLLLPLPSSLHSLPLPLPSGSPHATGKRRGRKPKQPLPSSTTSTTTHTLLTTTNQNFSVIVSDANAIHGVTGDPILLKGTSSDAVSQSGAATPPTHPPEGATPPGTHPSTVAASISSVSVIVPATLPSGEYCLMQCSLIPRATAVLVLIAYAPTQCYVH